MVSVVLKDLVLIPDARPVWPADFRVQVEAAEAEAVAESAPRAAEGEDVARSTPNRAAMGILADWCREVAGEPEFAAAWLWLHKRPVVRVQRHGISGRGRDGWWQLENQPRSLGYESLAGPSGTGLAGLVARLADRLAELRKELE